VKSRLASAHRAGLAMVLGCVGCFALGVVALVFIALRL
jgi:hypothetical protein